MNQLNRFGAHHITIYHKFHSEVDYYRQHWWQCQVKKQFTFQNFLPLTSEKPEKTQIQCSPLSFPSFSCFYVMK
jgi:hypothetical protein